MFESVRIGRALRVARETKNLSREEASIYLKTKGKKISAAGLTKYEKGNAPDSAIKSIREIIETLEGYEGAMIATSSYLSSIENNDKQVFIPILRGSAGGGFFIESQSNQEFVSIPLSEFKEYGSKPSDCTAIRIEGDSMLSTFFDGDLVVFEKIDHFIDGVMCVIVNGSIFVKDIERMLNGREFILKSHNPTYANQIINLASDEVSFLGKYKFHFTKHLKR